jgi:hypothetical protein
MAEKEVRKSVPRKTTRKTTARKTAVKKTATTTRKAPSRAVPAETASRPAASSRRGLSLLLGPVLFFIVIGISAGIGYSDHGALDVPSAILERKQNATPEERAALDAVPTQQGNAAPNGGLVASGKPAPEPEPVTASSTENGTSTESAASSTPETNAAASSTEAAPTEEPAEVPVQQ